MTKKLVSVIITTKNEEKNIERLLRSIKRQSYEKVEVILVDNNSSDRTVEIVKRFTKFVYQKGPERSAQRNHGAKNSNGEYLLFLDADMELTKNVVRDCVTLLSGDKRVGGVIIPEVSIATNFLEMVKSFERSFYNQDGDSVTEAARFFPKKVFKLANGYDENITGPEDWDLPDSILKKGYLIARIKEHIYHYEKIPSVYSLFRKKMYYGYKANRYLKKQQISPISAKTIYFLRPVFYKQWKRLIKRPDLFIGLMFVFTIELLGGGLGYLWGAIRNK